MRIGYARVSTADQNPDLQEDALQKAALYSREQELQSERRFPGTRHSFDQINAVPWQAAGQDLVQTGDAGVCLG